MSRRLTIKVAILAVLIVVSMVCMGVLLASMQDNLSLEDANEEIRLEQEDLPGLLETAQQETTENTTTFDDVYRSKAATIAFMANNNVGFELTDAKMAEYRDLMGVDNVIVVDREGKVLAQAQESYANFSYKRYNQLRTCFETGEPSQGMEVFFADQNKGYRYYADAIDNEKMVVVGQDPASLDALVAETGSLESILRNISVGQTGYVMAVSAQDYTVLYSPDASLVGADAFDRGLTVDELEEGYLGWIDFNGQRFYAGVSHIDTTYYVSMVPESDIVASRNITLAVILFIFFSVMATVILYGIFVSRKDEKRGYNPENYLNVGPLRFNKAIGRKAIILSFLGFLAVILVTFYMQTLFALSSESVRGKELTNDMQSTITRVNKQADELTAISDERYLNKAQVAAYILDRNPELATKEKLQELSDALMVEYAYVFDQNGTAFASNSPYATFSLSEDPEDQTYEFRQLLSGVDYVVQEPMADELTGQLRQYVGYTLRNADGSPNGFVELSIRSERLERMLSTVQIENILDGVKVGAGGFAFAVSKADQTFAYYPDETVVGKNALQAGMAESQLKDGYSDFVTINGERLYATSLETDDYYVYVAEPESSLMNNRVPLTVATGVGGLICQIIIFLLVTLSTRRPMGAKGAETEAALKAKLEDGADPEQLLAAEDAEEERMFDVVMPSGRVTKTESAASRWLYRSLRWGERSAEQRLLTVVKVLITIFALTVCVAVIFNDRFFPPDSVFNYILGGEWQKGLNVFAVTACLMIACVVMVLTMLVRQLLRLLASVFGARGETMCRLVSSFIKYACIIGMVYYCLMVIGIDTTTLLASAGILSIAISFGAKELVADILSGLFIIFEGEFRVGDIISVGSRSGTVMEIGIRTTKINDGNGNIIIIRNSEVSNVVNMTKESSFAACDLQIEYGESLVRVENVLEKEFPNIRERLSAIEEGPFYRGVVSLADNSVVIRIVAQCAEQNRAPLERDLRREMKLIFDRYDINIPYPQVVVHEPKEFKKATAAEQMRADRFREEQKEASRNIIDDDNDFDLVEDSSRR